jgi:adenosylmethionine-8-amino-7-oxononanoate transaminase
MHPHAVAEALSPAVVMIAHLWLPFTQMASFDFAERTFVRGEGCELVDARGRRVFDAISSVWTTIHGHAHPHIVEAIARQAATLDHATALGAANPPALALAEELAALTGLHRVFFSSDGASAIEVALKIALQYWQNIGQPRRRRFVRLACAYHGDTAAAMSVSDIALFKERFSPLLFETIAYEGAPGVLKRDDVAAVIVEPIVQAAAGMRLVSPSLYEPLKARAATEATRPLLIVDEIATGFGRTGPMFAFSRLDLQPDLLCLGKGLTGGTLPLSATLARQHVYDAFLGEYPLGRHLYHGHSYAANPIACAAALASLELFEREETLAHAASLSERLGKLLEPLAGHRAVREIRRAGLMCAIELEADALRLSDRRTKAWAVADQLYERGHFTRPLGAAIQLVPPLAASAEELGDFVRSLGEILDAAA